MAATTAGPANPSIPAFTSTTADVQPPKDLELGMIGNCTISALVDRQACINWCCFPRFDGDPIFCTLLRKGKDIGFFDIGVENAEEWKQSYVRNTAILKTVACTRRNEVEIIDFCPRFLSKGRTYRPTMIIRIINPIRGRPRIRIRLRPTFGYGWGVPERTRGSNHLRYLLPSQTIRLTTNAPIAYIYDEVLFELDEPIYLLLMPDESLSTSIAEMCLTNLANTKAFWEDYVKNIAVPVEYQEAVIRAGITLSLNTYEETGSIISAATTSIPYGLTEARNHDLRYCWLRDSHQIVATLAGVGSTSTMEHYLRYLSNIVANVVSNPSSVQAVYGIALDTRIQAKEMHRLAGYRSHGPVTVGTDDVLHRAHDTYGAVILALQQTFYDQRLRFPGDEQLYSRLEAFGKLAHDNYQKPDAGPIGVASESDYRLHTFSIAMCWAACDRLARIAKKLQLSQGHESWTAAAKEIAEFFHSKCWNAELNSFVSVPDTQELDAYLLQLPELGIISASDPKYLGTLKLLEQRLRRGNYLLRREKDTVASTTASLWFIRALAGMDRADEARKMFEQLLREANNLGLLSEGISVASGGNKSNQKAELWGNFPHTTANVALMHAAVRLSKPWSEAL